MCMLDIQSMLFEVSLSFLLSHHFCTGTSPQWNLIIEPSGSLHLPAEIITAVFSNIFSLVDLDQATNLASGSCTTDSISTQFIHISPRVYPSPVHRPA